VLLAVACTGTKMPELTGDPLNPELYRAQIVAIDAVVFEDGPLGEAGRNQVGSTLLVLADAAEADPTNTIAKFLGKDMRTLASRVKQMRVGTPLTGSQLQQQWRRIRGSLFDDAAWFRQSSADPIEPARRGNWPSRWNASDTPRACTASTTITEARTCTPPRPSRACER